MKIESDRFYLPREIAEFLRCGQTNVYGLMSSGDLAVTKIGAGKKGLRVRGSAITAFLEDRTDGGPSPKGSFKYLKGYVD